MSHEQIQQSLHVLGLHRYDASQLRQKKATLLKQINIGLNRKDPLQRGFDGGLKAIKTGVDPITSEQWAQVPEGGTVITCAFAGTNWITGSVTKTGDKAVYKELRKETIPIEKRTVTYDELVQRMTDQILISKSMLKMNISTLAISFGFPHENIIDEKGNIDARILSAEPSKFWHITDFEEHKNDLLGKSILEKLNNSVGKKQIEHFVIQNDTNAVAHATDATAVKKLPVGFVFGTGDNASLFDRNLEAGFAVIDSDDMIFTEMKKRGLVPTAEDKNTIEFKMGGDYIKFRAIAALGLLQQHGQVDYLTAQVIINKLKKSKDGTIMSKIASNKLGRKGINKLLKTFGIINEKTADAIQQIAQTTLKQAGQMMGVLISAVTEAAGHTKGDASMNIEGSVYWNADKVKETADETLHILNPESNIQAINASGLIGIAQLGMVRMMNAAK